MWATISNTPTALYVNEIDNCCGATSKAVPISSVLSCILYGEDLLLFFDHQIKNSIQVISRTRCESENTPV